MKQQLAKQFGARWNKSRKCALSMSPFFSLLTTLTMLSHEAQTKRWIARRKQKETQNYSVWSYSPHPTELLNLPVVWRALSQKSLKEIIRAACHTKHMAHMSKHCRVMQGLRTREQCCCLCKSLSRPPCVNKASKAFQRQTCPHSPHVGYRYFPLKLGLWELLLPSERAQMVQNVL